MDESDSSKVNDVQQHLKKFLVLATGSTSPSKTPKVPNWSSMTLKELTESPIFLLKNVPVCKPAVFDYCRIIVIENAHMYLCQLENPSSVGDPDVLEDAIVEMSTTLKVLVDANPGNWLSLIFQWTLESLAEMSKRFHSRRYLNNKTLSDLLKIYTANRATNSILELLNLCAGHLLTNSPEKCVAALLEIAARYGAFCDWILTFISIAYPLKIINQLVNCGLNDFISHTTDLSKNMPLNQAVQRCEQYNREKLSSLASILSHLAVQQTTELRHCFVALIEQALSTDFVKKRQDIFAFLLKLCVFSRNIVDVVMKDLPKYSTTQNCIQIVSALSVMPPHVLFSDQSPATAIINIISLLNDHKNINFTVDQLTKFAYSNFLEFTLYTDSCMQVYFHLRSLKEMNQHRTDVVDFTDEQKNIANLMRTSSLHILNIMIYNMENIIHSQYALSIDRFPMLQRIDEIFLDTVACLITVSHKTEECRFYFKLVCLLCLIRGVEKATLVLAVILFKAKDAKQLALFVDFCCILSPFMPKLAHQLITKMFHLFDSIKNSTAAKTTIWTCNLLTLLEWESAANGNDCILLNLSRAISENYHNFVLQIYARSFEASSKDDLDTLSYLLNILFKIGPPIRLSLAESYRIVTSCVRLLLVNISMTDMENQEKRLANLSLIEEHALKLLHSQSSAAFSEMFCKLFFHSLLFNERYKNILSCRQSPEEFVQEPVCSSLPLLNEDPYLHDNYIAPTRLVHSGKLRQLNKPSRASAIDEKKTRRLVNFVDRFCHDQKVSDNVSKNDTKDGHPRSYDIAFCRQLSLKLNEYVCHDAIAAEHSWDEWEYTKMNVERFLTTAKRIEELPFCWDLLLIASRGYPALWYSLPLLRSTLASVMLQLEAAIDKKAEISTDIKSVLHRWFSVAKEGKILADPLVRLYEVIQQVSNYEAFLILLQVWKYFQKYWPDLTSLDKHFECRLQLNDKSILSGDPDPYLAPIRPIMQANVASVGHLFRTLFMK